MAPRHALIYLVLVLSGASAFQVRPEVRKLRNAFYSSSVAMSLSKDTGDNKIPFFARALEKLRKSKKEDSDHPVLRKHENEDTIGDSEAATLRALSEKTRLEAEKMDMLLTLTKIDKLEERLADKDDHPNLLRNAQILMKKFAPLALENTTTEAPISTDGGDSNPSNNHQEISKNKVKEILDGDKPLLSDDMREDAIQAFKMLPEPLKDMMARTVGMKDGSNATAAIDMLMAENRLYEGDDEQKFSMIAKTEDLMEDIILDPDFVEINNFIRKLLPATTRKEPVKQEYIDALYSEVFGKDTFNPKERKPEAVPGGYLVRGVSKVRPKKEEDDGDVLIQALDRKISESSLAGKIQVYYILDPTPPSGEEIMNDEDETPVLLITGHDISPDTQVWVKPTITLLGLASIGAFALGSTILNPAVQQTLATESEASGSLYELSLPLALYLLMLQAVVFVGHLFVSVKDGIQIGLPTLVPSFQLGLTGSITPIKTSPKNIKSLFDFAITGPLLGLTASLVLLYSGLFKTVIMDSSAQLPSVPVEILRSSALGGSIIDFLLGGVLNSPYGSVVNLHPLAIAGFAGMVTNALSLVPIGNTDGGRISLAFFGRSFSRAIQVAAAVILVSANLFGADPANILLGYVVFTQIWQSEPEVPCRNEVDELDLVRGFAAIALWTLVILILVPMPIQP